MGRFPARGGYAANHAKVSAAGAELPSSPLDPKCKACPAYNIKGMCNTGCGNVGDHVINRRWSNNY